MKCVEIEWEGPFRVLYDREKDSYFLPDDIPDELSKSNGIYQIYGDHVVYGRGVLLYIGETKSQSASRNMRKRLLEHLSGRFYEHVGLKVSFGLVKHKDRLITNAKEIQAVESLLIAANKPVLNRKFLDFASEKAGNILVRNWGFIGSLLPECSGGYWCK